MKSHKVNYGALLPTFLLRKELRKGEREKAQQASEHFGKRQKPQTETLNSSGTEPVKIYTGNFERVWVLVARFLFRFLLLLLFTLSNM